MEQKVLAADLRDNTGKGASRRLRMAGKIPAIVYGAGEPLKVSIDSREFGASFKEIHENEIIDLKVGKKDRQVFIKDYQKDILTGIIGHIDFYEIEKGKLLKTNVPIHFIGNPVGVREGGILEHKVEELEVECLPKDMPEYIEVDLSNLSLGDTLHLSDIPEVKGVKFLTHGNPTVAVVSHAKAEVVATEDEVEEEIAEEAAGE